MPNVQGNVSITAMPNVQGNVSITALPNVSITALPNVSITAMPNVQGNVVVSGNVSITAMPNVQGNVSITALPNVSITAMPNVQGNVSITAMPNVQGNVVVSGVVMLADQYGNHVGPANPTGMAVDAFGRARVSTPLTLFDSSHRYRDNGLWSTSNTATATYVHNANAGLVELRLDTTSNAEIIRETTKVFSYQPGKSLQIMNTVVMNPAKTGLRQRVGYFGAQNGYYLELDGTNVYLVERSYVTGAVTEVRVAQADWNVDTLLGNVASSPSKITLDLSKGQIFFTDIEWLGLGTVRCGFVIDGVLVHVHSFNHANIVTAPYISTASLPVRYEIKNTGITASNSTMKQVCSTVISEGGYELRGAQQAIGTPINAARTIATAGTFYPIVSLRLKSSALDAIVILTALSTIADTSSNFNWQVRANCTTGGGTWVSAGTDSSIEYNITGTSTTGGKVLASGYFTATQSTSVSVDILKEALFKFQLERNGLNGTPYEISLVLASKTNNEGVYGSIDWEEISR
jgi:hypothetical protein